MLNNNQKKPSETPKTTQTTTPVTTTTIAEKKPQQTIIEVTTEGFSPDTITVKAGTRVLWINTTNKTVSLNAADHPTHQVYPPLNLGRFGKNSSVQLVFDKIGTYEYHDHLNPDRKGTVVVE